MHTILIMQGLPASGKSTYAKQWTLEDAEHRIRVNKDDIRRMLGFKFSWHIEKLVKIIQKEAILYAIEEGFSVVVDNTNFNEEELKDIEDMVKQFNSIVDADSKYSIEYKNFFNVSVEECIKRDKNREYSVGEKVITDMYNKYKETINKK